VKEGSTIVPVARMPLKIRQAIGQVVRGPVVGIDPGATSGPFALKDDERELLNRIMAVSEGFEAGSTR
jgi:hypothetical protein